MLLENTENEETFLIYLFEWEPGLTEQNSNFLPKWDTLLITYRSLSLWYLRQYVRMKWHIKSSLRANIMDI